MVRTLAGATRQTVELDTVQIHPISRMALLHTQMATRTYAETAPPGLESMEPPQRMQTQIGETSGIPGHSNVAPLYLPDMFAGDSLVLPGYRRHFRHPLLDLLKKPTSFKQNWLANVIAAKQRYQRILQRDDELVAISKADSQPLHYFKYGYLPRNPRSNRSS